jgi:hypothetical protein
MCLLLRIADQNDTHLWDHFLHHQSHTFCCLISPVSGNVASLVLSSASMDAWPAQARPDGKRGRLIAHPPDLAFRASALHSQPLLMVHSCCAEDEQHAMPPGECRRCVLRELLAAPTSNARRRLRPAAFPEYAMRPGERRRCSSRRAWLHHPRLATAACGSLRCLRTASEHAALPAVFSEYTVTF